MAKDGATLEARNSSPDTSMSAYDAVDGSFTGT